MPIKPFVNYSGPQPPAERVPDLYVKVTRKNNKDRFKFLLLNARGGRIRCDALEHDSKAGCPNPACKKYVEPKQRQKNLWKLEDEEEERIKNGGEPAKAPRSKGQGNVHSDNRGGGIPASFWRNGR